MKYKEDRYWYWATRYHNTRTLITDLNMYSDKLKVEALQYMITYRE